YINNILFNYLNNFYIAYLDNIIIYFINKLKFSIKRIKYLGFIISIDKIKANPEKTAIIN
ncbi:uncharacterized protein K441DRAFT_559696, partial [Cenococcum geophilum 1.58]|uniref:uncharacterized protein n=1 Tax=Cenococcum geophilum 1.58 TaxID=794803 RepID=UPI00358E58E7